MSNRPAFGKKNAFVAQAIATPVAAPSLKSPSASVAQDRKARWPFLSLGLCVLFTYVFLLELQHRGDPVRSLAISLRDSVAQGGISRYLVLYEHEWWRMLTAPFLHGSVEHIAGNSAALLLAGFHLERLVGRAWLALLFFVGAIGGSLGSLILNSETIVSVGASGAIMCLITVMFALSFHVEAGKVANRMRIRALLTIIPAFLPNVAASATQIDLGAHFGGFAPGMAMGFLLLIIWSEEMPVLPGREVAGCGAALGTALALYAASQVVSHYPAYAAREAELVPTPVLTQSDFYHSADDLVARYPHDPTARFLYAAVLLSHGQYDDVEEQARAGLSEHEMLATEFPPVVEQRLDLLLMAALWGEGRKDEARDMAEQVCAVSSDPFLHEARPYLVKAGACK